MEFYSRPAAQLVSLNPVVPHDELWAEEDTGKVKRGFGSTRWNDLPYWADSATPADVDALEVRATALEPAATMRHMTDNVSNSTLVLSDATGLSFPVAANATYIFEFTVYSFSAVTSTGIALSVNGPASPTYIRYGILSTLSTSTAGGNGWNAYETAVVFGSNLAVEANSPPSTLTGYLVNGVNAGTLTLRFRSEIDTSAVTIVRGSWGRLTRVA